MIDLHRLHTAYDRVQADLWSHQVHGHWEGSLASSALSTATAISALALVQRHAQRDAAIADHQEDQRRLESALAYLQRQQNDDGGWGDTDKSHSNIATTMLAVAALHLAGRAESWSEPLQRANDYLQQRGGVAGLRERYGKDKTFAVPILTNCALAGLVDWSEVAPLPFELACVPQRFYHLTRMPVVSYAVPALVAIGQARFYHQPPRWPWMRWLRRAAAPGSLRVLERMQPASGGYLEAVPLTSFVVMSLAASGRVHHPVAARGLEFLRQSMRADGSFPIDTNLATWNTTLAINGLSAVGADLLGQVDLDWLLSCQHTQRHPFTGAAPGGWGWTDISGAVPDADDTAGALLALAHLRSSPQLEPAPRERLDRAARLAIRWLLDLQNRDGGWPTFCRGWGKLPFDRSGADLTAHVLQALQAWRGPLAGVPDRQIASALKRGWRYLQQQQREDGSWVPLWFGNQDHPDEENPVFGTARVLQACRALGWSDTPPAQRGYRWLESVQLEDGSWSGFGVFAAAGGGPPAGSVEETALALDALLGVRDLGSAPRRESVSRGLEWLVATVLAGHHTENAPIGFYFAKLWYHERLYPLVFAAAALGQALRLWSPDNTHTRTGNPASAAPSAKVPPRPRA